MEEGLWKKGYYGSIILMVISSIYILLMQLFKNQSAIDRVDTS